MSETMKETRKQTRRETRRMMHKMRVQFFSLWVLTAIAPLVIYILYITVLVGPDTMRVFINPQELNNEIWQLSTWNRNELLFRYINNIVLEDPYSLIEGESMDFIQNVDLVENMNTLLLVRRGDSFYAINDFESDEGQKVADRLNSVTSIKMPEFSSVYYTFNQELFDKTGYSITKQLDFYFPDGEEGSVLFLKKVFNVSTMIGKFLLNYFIILFLLYLVGIGILTITTSLKFSKRFERVVEVTEAISHENFDARIDTQEDSPFTPLNSYINKMAERLAVARDYRLETEQMRKDFIDNMTHDLKTPLTAIKVQVESLKDGIVTEPEKVDRYLDNIKKKVDNIDLMLNELKVFSELTNGNELYDFQPINLHDYVKDITDEWLFETTEDVQLKYVHDLDMDSIVAIDVYKMKRVLLNIFENSLKYVQQRPIEITIDIEKKDAEHIVLIISDNGNGVPDDQLGYIFKQYFRLDDARNPSVAGSGLGLTICREIIAAHKGEIMALNQKPHGLGIYIVLRRENG